MPIESEEVVMRRKPVTLFFAAVCLWALTWSVQRPPVPEEQASSEGKLPTLVDTTHRFPIIKAALAPRPVSSRKVDRPQPPGSTEPADSTQVAVFDSTVEVTKPVEMGEASYYGNELAGQPTASGEPFDPAELTAAHPTLPLGSKLRVTNTRNGRSIIVRVNDRGPFRGKRVIDVSREAARKLGMLQRGTAMVTLELIKKKGK